MAAPSSSTPDSTPPVLTKSPSDSVLVQGLAPFRFQLDARLGLGTVNVTADGSPMLSGLGLPLVVSAGLSLTRALVVFGEISDTHMLFFDTEASNGTNVFDLYGAGLGLKYYVTPNCFLSGSASIARLQFQGGNYAMDISHWGGMARVSVGGEWPVAPTWSVGVAGEYQAAAMQSGALSWGYPTDPPEKRYRFSGLSMLVLASFHQAETSATGPPAPTSPPSSLGRLYLDTQVGMGRLWPRVGGPFWITGTSIPLVLSAGIHVTRAVVLFGELSDIHMFGPAANGGPLLYSLDLYGVGLGLKYYLTPRAWFLSLSGAMAQLHYDGLTSLSGYAFNETSRWGVLARVAFGREWAISPSWSLGAAGEVQFGSMHVGDNFQGTVYDGGEPTNGAPYTIKGLSLLGLATFNPPPERQSGEAEATGSVPAGYHTHHGFYASANIGVGWLWVTGAPQELSGRGTSLAASAGYGFADHLVAFGEYSETKVNGPAGDTSVALSWYGLGPGLRYYLMPANVFLSGSLLLSRVAESAPPPGSEGTDAYTRPSDWGFTGQISVGKGWWLLGDFGVGVATELGIGKMAGSGYWSTPTVKQLSLLASVGFN